MKLTPADRAAAYTAAFPTFPPLLAHGRWLLGVFTLGQFYAGQGFYGSFPRGSITRLQAIFPDIWARGRPRGRLLHLFSGSLPKDVGGIRLDLLTMRRPDVAGDAQRLPLQPASIDHVLADPHYSEADGKKYGLPPSHQKLNRRRVFYELARVVRRGGHVIWMDEVLPIFAKRVWHWWGVIGMTLGTNRRGRFVFMFERVGGRL